METGDARRLGGRDVATIAVGAMVGVGIFFNPRDVAARAGDGPTALLVWTLGGLVALLGALTFAELGARYPRAGGQFRVLVDAFGPRAGVAYMAVVGVVESSAAVAILALVCAQFTAVACDLPADGTAESALFGAAPPAMLILAAFGLAAAGVRQGATALAVNVALKLATALAVIGLAIAFTPEASATPSAPVAPAPPTGGAWAWTAAFLPAFFAYGGFQQSLWIGGEVKDPGRNLPRGIVAGTAIVVAIYVGLNAAYLKLLGYEGVTASSAVAADAAAVVFPWAGRATAAVVAWSAFGCMQTILFTGPHQVVALAEDGFAPRALARRTPRGAPVLATACFAGVALALAYGAGRSGVGGLLDAVVCVDWIFFTLTGLALFVLRRRNGPPEGFRAPGYPFLPALFVAAAALAAASPFFADDSRLPGAVALGFVVVAWGAAGLLRRDVRAKGAGG
jgi:APA family basic amino acid/polyamine antiporter